ncbi:MAG: cell wall hydrolase [Oscillospiraceae bacterium]|nr:cell wall hydrolase [Oscillospiraceae bacterium]
MRYLKAAASVVCVAFISIISSAIMPGNGWTVAKTDIHSMLRDMDTAAAVSAAMEADETTDSTTAATRCITTAASTVTTTTETITDASAEAAAETTIFTEAPVPEITSTETTAAAESPAAESTSVSTTAVTAEESQQITETTAVPANGTQYAVSVTEREYIMLCNIVGHEYGASWIPTEEKALVAEVIMNRVNSSQFPNTVYEVLTQKNQFAGLEYLIEMETMSHYVTDSVRDAVDLYLTHPEQYQHGYLFFNGDGRKNYFRTSY